jgi:hypothetical protein
MEVLTTYVREHAPKKTEVNPLQPTIGTPSADIQAILTVIGRRVEKGRR